MDVTIVGSGYVGLTTAAILSNVGHKVYCVDVDQKKLNTIASGRSYFFEPGLDQIVRKGIDNGNLIPTDDYSQSIPKSEIAFICVGTPANDDGSSDLRYIYAAAEAISGNMKDGLVVATKSTVPVGTSTRVKEILQKSKKDFSIASCPEFLAEGTAVFDTLVFDRVIIGHEDERSYEKIKDLMRSVDEYAKSFKTEKLLKYSGIFRSKAVTKNQTPYDDRVLSMSLESAELVKVTANAFLATKISFANSIARICDLTGANINEVMNGVGMDKRIGRDFLYAGLGWGGGCFPKDVSGILAYSQSLGFDFKMLEEAARINFDQVNYTYEKSKQMLDGDLKGKKVTILGLSFKAGTDDIRRSPAISLIQKLQNDGASLTAYDPQAIEEAKVELNGVNVHFAESAEDAMKDAELTILATEWPEFEKIDYKKVKDMTKSPKILDARNRLKREEMEKLGYEYQAIGQ